MNRAEKAVSYFNQDYACSQSVCLALKDFTNMNEDTLLNIAGGFGGGIGDAKTVCGAVSGAIMTIGLNEGAKHQVLMHKNANIRLKCDEFVRLFNAKHGTYTCPVIIEQARKQGKRPQLACSHAVANAVEIVEKLLG